MARHGRPYGTYWRPGVYAKDIARRVSCPTLAVPEAREGSPTSDAPFAEILCPMDFSSASEVAVNQALILAQQSGARITLLHVLEGSYASAEEYRSLARKRGLGWRYQRIPPRPRDHRLKVQKGRGRLVGFGISTEVP